MSELWGYLSQEAMALAALLSTRSILTTLVLVVAVAGAARIARWIVHASWRIGFDRRRRLAWWLTALKAVVLVGAVLILVRALLATAPVLGMLVISVAAVVGLTLLRSQLENVAVGIGFVFRNRLREGDRVTLGDVSGVVREFGLSRLHLRRPDGASVLVPNRLLNTSLVLVEQSRHTARVTLTIELPEPPNRYALERMRRAAVLSPYRARGTAMTVTLDLDRPARVTVEIQVHASNLIGAATRQLEVVLVAAASELPETRRGKRGGYQREPPPADLRKHAHGSVS